MEDRAGIHSQRGSTSSRSLLIRRRFAVSRSRQSRPGASTSEPSSSDGIRRPALRCRHQQTPRQPQWRGTLNGSQTRATPVGTPKSRNFRSPRVAQSRCASISQRKQVAVTGRRGRRKRRCRQGFPSRSNRTVCSLSSAVQSSPIPAIRGKPAPKNPRYPGPGSMLSPCPPNATHREGVLKASASARGPCM